MGLYEVPLSVFVEFCDGDYVSQLPYVFDTLVGVFVIVLYGPNC